MPVGDWVDGTYIRLDQSILNHETWMLAASWKAVLPSGMDCGFLGPHAHQTDPQNTVEQEVFNLAVEIADQEGVPVRLPRPSEDVGYQQVNPDGSTGPLELTPGQGGTPPTPAQTPHITSTDPTLGSPGTAVAIHGTGLTGIAPDGVDFDGVRSTDAVAVSDQQVNFSVPSHPPGGVYLHVTVNGVVNPEMFTFFVNP
jgi:IPT/TIG domain